MLFYFWNSSKRLQLKNNKLIFKINSLLFSQRYWRFLNPIVQCNSQLSSSFHRDPFLFALLHNFFVLLNWIEGCKMRFFFITQKMWADFLQSYRKDVHKKIETCMKNDYRYRVTKGNIHDACFSCSKRNPLMGFEEIPFFLIHIFIVMKWN